MTNEQIEDQNRLTSRINQRIFVLENAVREARDLLKYGDMHSAQIVLTTALEAK